MSNILNKEKISEIIMAQMDAEAEELVEELIKEALQEPDYKIMCDEMCIQLSMACNMFEDLKKYPHFKRPHEVIIKNFKDTIGYCKAMEGK